VITEFTEKQAIDHAAAALDIATTLGQPTGSVIYFAVDFNPQISDINTIRQYFATVKKNIGKKYGVGVYGNAAVCEAVKSDGINYTWLSHSTGAYGNNAPGVEGTGEYISYDSQEKYNIKQNEKVQYNKIDFDNDTAKGDDYGQW